MALAFAMILNFIAMICSLRLLRTGTRRMPDGLWLILSLIAVVIVYVIAKVFFYMRKSEEQWQQVDKSKLREWEDEDD
jgi:beta-lactamase regulating signal transducer with metallopeptidase domain